MKRLLIVTAVTMVTVSALGCRRGRLLYRHDACPPVIAEPTYATPVAPAYGTAAPPAPPTVVAPAPGPSTYAPSP